jgi:hypothetical protein
MDEVVDHAVTVQATHELRMKNVFKRMGIVLNAAFVSHNMRGSKGPAAVSASTVNVSKGV